MTITEKIQTDIKEALKKNEAVALSVLRMLSAALHNEAINLMKKEKGLSAEEEIKVLKREAKKRKDAIELYIAGQRPELAEKEKQELAVLNRYLPAEMSEEELKKIVVEVIAEMGEVLPSQFGLVMKNVMAKTQGQAEGNLVSRLVKEVLNKEIKN